VLPAASIFNITICSRSLVNNPVFNVNIAMSLLPPFLSKFFRLYINNISLFEFIIFNELK